MPDRNPYELTCQVPRGRPRTGTGRVHGVRLSRVTRPVRPTGRVLDDVADVGPGRVAAWCYQCSAASEFEYVEADGRAA